MSTKRSTASIFLRKVTLTVGATALSSFIAPYLSSFTVQQVHSFSQGYYTSRAYSTPSPPQTSNRLLVTTTTSLCASVDESKSEWTFLSNSEKSDHTDLDAVEKKKVFIATNTGDDDGKKKSHHNEGQHHHNNNGSSSSSSSSVDINNVGEAIDKEIAKNEALKSGVMSGVDPAALEIVSVDDLDDALSITRKQPAFVRMFRGSAQYIANHRNTLVIYHIPGDLLEWSGFKNLMDDIALTWLLGIKVIIVTGCRTQLDRRLQTERQKQSFEHQHQQNNNYNNEEQQETRQHFGVRITDMNALRLLKEEAGHVRFEVERQLARSLRLHGGLNRNGCDGNVLSGNFYSAQPFGVIDGVDYMYTGFPRRVEVEKIRQCHISNDIVLMTSLGASPSGEVFNVNSEFLAATVAGAMSASKVVFFTVHGTAFRDKTKNKIIQNLRSTDAMNFLRHHKVRIHSKGFATIDDEEITHSEATAETLIKVGWALKALQKGVKRAHIIAPTNGALLQELYTRDGSGTLISRDLYEGIRPANVNDINGIYELIEPLVNRGTLVPRSKTTLEKDINTYYVYTRDSLVVACAQLKRFEDGFAEIGCMVVSKKYRSQGRGDAMLGYLERLSVQCGCSNVFVLSTQTMEWFIERGFKPASVDSLPPSRKAVYNHERKSKIYMKKISSDRDLDAAELWWNR